jgi:UDPglucose--hexose-1-phosphate uridylyltransferase
MELIETPHRRYNPLTGEWVLVSPQRTKRPWQGKQEEKQNESRLSYDSTCYLCPGNERVGGEKNDNYSDTFVFTNDFAALKPDIKKAEILSNDELFQQESVKGKCRVICFSPDHSLTLASMTTEQIVKVIKTWQSEYENLGKLDYVNYVQIFENKGEVMGCSNPHPHGQIWASDVIPDEPKKEHIQQKLYYDKHDRTLLSDYLKKELIYKKRILLENEEFVALIPFWAVWPFEAMILPKQSYQHINQLDAKGVNLYADIIRQLCAGYDKLFDVSFPYSAGIHQQPTDGNDYPEIHFHMHFYPPLLRSATVKKFMVGYEMLANPQRDITAEQSAEIFKDKIKNI